MKSVSTSIESAFSSRCALRTIGVQGLEVDVGHRFKHNHEAHAKPYSMTNVSHKELL
jgi:hypothetical protein